MCPVALAVLVAWIGGCGEPPAPEPPVPATTAGARPAGSTLNGELFVDVAAQAGIDFVHFNGMSGEFYFSENMGSGCGLFDYDNDGDLDAYFVQGAILGDGKTVEDAIQAPRHPLPLTDRLYRNELAETGALRFTDVTVEAGIDSTGYGMGVSAADYDGDGWIDLYVTNAGRNLLLHNDGDGSFSDVTEAAGADDDRWSTSAAFVDYDADGRLDLIFVNYVDFSPSNHKPCYSDTSAVDYCGPQSYQPYPDRLLRNLGDGKFEDVTAVSQIARHYGAGLGVVCTDFDGDGLVDIYVANDGMPNQLWINLGDGTFEDRALLSGCAFNEDGKAESSMGVDVADFDGDGDEDLFMTHLVEETNTLYVNDGTGWFDDLTSKSGLGAPSRSFTGFGTAWLDFDNDSLLDLFVANGAVTTIEQLERAGDPYPLHQINQLYHNRGGKFEEITGQAGAVFELSEVSRGVAAGDVDNDGDTDLLLSNNAGPARLLINQGGNRNHWIGLRLSDADGRSDVLGARVEVVRADGSSLWRRSRAAASYCSSNDPRVLVGLGSDSSIAEIRVHWPDGVVETWFAQQVDRYSELRRGTGERRK